jgi:archaellum component FlaF (FlaF/FlaG flagellin family)
MASADPAVVARAIQCLASTVENGAVNVNVLIVDAISGISTPDGDVANDGDVVVPDGWSAFTIVNSPSSTSNVTTSLGNTIFPGMSLTFDTWKQFPGETFTVTSPDADTTASVNWVIATPNP